jgi:hypothetical protein
MRRHSVLIQVPVPSANKKQATPATPFAKCGASENKPRKLSQLDPGFYKVTQGAPARGLTQPPPARGQATTRPVSDQRWQWQLV